MADEPTTEFDRIVAGLELEFSPADVVNCALLNDFELSRRFNKVRQDLLKLGQMPAGSVETETGRRLHSERAAYLIELRRRRLM